MCSDTPAPASQAHQTAAVVEIGVGSNYAISHRPPPIQRHVTTDGPFQSKHQSGRKSTTPTPHTPPAHHWRCIQINASIRQHQAPHTTPHSPLTVHSNQRINPAAPSTAHNTHSPLTVHSNQRINPAAPSTAHTTHSPLTVHSNQRINPAAPSTAHNTHSPLTVHSNQRINPAAPSTAHTTHSQARQLTVQAIGGGGYGSISKEQI